MKHRQKRLTDEQWELIEPLLPPPLRRRDNRGRPWASHRACREGSLWILQTGAAWRFLPDEFPSPSTCGRRQWEEQGVWLDAWRALLGAHADTIPIRCGSGSGSAALTRSCPAGRTTKPGATKTAESSAGTNAAGAWSEPTPGLANSADCWFVMNICSSPAKPSSTSLASGLL